MKCKWRTLPSGKFGTSCDEILDWKIKDLDNFVFCPYCSGKLIIMVAKD